MTVRLEELLAAAPPGSWRVIPSVAGRFGASDAFVRAADDKTVATGVRSDQVAALIALAPDAVRLLIDMGDYLNSPYSQATANALLARLDRLGNTT